MGVGRLTIIVTWSILSVYLFHFTYFAALLFGVYIFSIGVLLVDWPLYHYVITHSVPGKFLCWEVYFVRCINTATPVSFDYLRILYKYFDFQFPYVIIQVFPIV